MPRLESLGIKSISWKVVSRTEALCVRHDGLDQIQSCCSCRNRSSRTNGTKRTSTNLHNLHNIHVHVANRLKSTEILIFIQRTGDCYNAWIRIRIQCLTFGPFLEFCGSHPCLPDQSRSNTILKKTIDNNTTQVPCIRRVISTQVSHHDEFPVNPPEEPARTNCLAHVKQEVYLLPQTRLAYKSVL